MNNAGVNIYGQVQGLMYSDLGYRNTGMELLVNLVNLHLFFQEITNDNS